MASIPCTFQLSTAASRRVSPRAAAQGRGQGGGGAVLRTPLLGAGRRGLGWLRPSRLSRVVPSSESGRAGPTCWFKFGNKDAEGAGIYGSQARDDFDRDDVEQVILTKLLLHCHFFAGTHLRCVIRGSQSICLKPPPGD